MRETAERYRRVAADFTARVEAVPADCWDNQTPCDEWVARDIIGHVIDSTQTFFDLIGRELPAGPPVAENPVGAWRSARDAMQAALDDPEVATTEYESPITGRATLERGVDMFVCFDLLVHAWDLARATGLDERLDPDEVHAVFETAKPMDEMLRGPGVMGPKLQPRPGADEQEQLLAFLGREV